MDTSNEEEKPSKSLRKRAAQESRRIAEQLTQLSSKQLAQVSDQNLREAVEQAIKITKGNARKRQIQYIAKLIRNTDPVLLQDYLSKIDPRSNAQLIKIRKLERWRDGLIDNQPDAFEQFIQENPDVDRQQLRQLVRHAIAEKDVGLRTDYYRRLFQFLRSETGND